MKKYIKPSIEETVIELTPLMDNSVTNITGLDGVTTSNEEYDPSNGGVDSRRHSFWGDDEY